MFRFTDSQKTDQSVGTYKKHWPPKLAVRHKRVNSPRVPLPHALVSPGCIKMSCDHLLAGWPRSHLSGTMPSATVVYKPLCFYVAKVIQFPLNATVYVAKIIQFPRKATVYVAKVFKFPRDASFYVPEVIQFPRDATVLYKSLCFYVATVIQFAKDATAYVPKVIYFPKDATVIYKSVLFFFSFFAWLKQVSFQEILLSMSQFSAMY